MLDTEEAKEQRDARSFGITVPQLRQQRREFGQLLSGPYAGCSPEFAQMMETCKEVQRLLTWAQEAG